jgi:hypothetical protein
VILSDGLVPHESIALLSTSKDEPAHKTMWALDSRHRHSAAPEDFIDAVTTRLIDELSLYQSGQFQPEVS